MVSDKEIEAAIKAFQMAHTAKVDIPLEQSMRDALEAAARVREDEPVIHARFETVDKTIPVIGTTEAPIKRVEQNDDDSYTVVIDHWPQPSGTVEALKRIAQLKEVRRGGGVFDYEPALSAMEMYEIAFDALAASKPHPDDEAVDRFAAAMKAKLKWEREERGRHGWNDPEVCSEEYLAKLLIEHLAKGNEGNFEDVANICMMLHQRGAHPRVLADALTAGGDDE